MEAKEAISWSVSDIVNLYLKDQLRDFFYTSVLSRDARLESNRER